MTRSELFTAAHALTRRTIQDGDSYRVTFGACLKYLIANPPAEERTDLARCWDIADALEAEDLIANVWQPGDVDWARVYIKRTLSRRRVQEMGFVEVRNGEVRVCVNRRRAFIRDLAVAA